MRRRRREKTRVEAQMDALSACIKAIDTFYRHPRVFSEDKDKLIALIVAARHSSAGIIKLVVER